MSIKKKTGFNYYKPSALLPPLLDRGECFIFFLIPPLSSFTPICKETFIMVSRPSFTPAALANMVDRSIGFTNAGLDRPKKPVGVVWNNDQHVGWNETYDSGIGDGKIDKLNVITAIADTAKFAQLNGLVDDNYLYQKLIEINNRMPDENAVYDVTKF
jgi:hypothetical protein